MSLALIDGDVILYRNCFGHKDKSFGELAPYLNQTMQYILDACSTRQYILYVGGSGNFRKQLDPTYKAQRVAEKPPNFEEAKEFLITKWSSKVTTDCETDDELGILLTENQQDGVICSNDKDFLQIPGKHFNFVTAYFSTITHEIGMFNFYRQMLWGDTADNVKGIPGVGKVKSGAILFGKSTEEREEVVRELYDNHNLDYELNRKLLWISRTREYLEQLQEEAHQLSISQRSMVNTMVLTEESSEDGWTKLRESGIPCLGDLMA